LAVFLSSFKIVKKTFILIIIFLLSGFMTFSQQSRQEFGQNRVQYEYFNWRYYSTTNFDIYFYGNSDKTAKEVAIYLEEEFDRITDVIGHSPYFKAKIFLYNSVNDLQQSNIGVNQQSYRIGGQTNFTKSFVEVANPGSIEGLKVNLVTEVSRLVLNDMVFGGSLSDMWQNTYLMSLPDWFVQGASEYLAKGWDIEMDDQIRDLVMSGKVKKLSNLTGRQGVIAGQSLWNFIVENYGKSNLNQILNLVRVTRNEEKSISFTLGVSFKQVLLEWQQYYSDMVITIEKNYSSPDDSYAVGKLKGDELYSSVKISPDGTNLAYAINDDGKYRVYIRNLSTNNSTKIFSGGHKLLNQKVDKTNPIINWADDKTLGIISYAKGKNVLWLYDLESKSKIASLLERFDHVGSFDFSANGRLAALSATRAGRTDIYLLSVRRNKIRQLTNDYYDDLTPSFIPGTNTILFSSNRVNDTIKSNVRELKSFSQNYNLFAFNLDTTRQVLARITNTISKDFAPVAENKNTIYYLSDQKGIINLFKYTIDDRIYSQITNFENNIVRYDINFLKSNGAFTMNRELRQKLYYVPSVKLKANVFTPLTPRQAQFQARYLSQRRLISAAKEREKEAEVIPPKVEEIDTLGLDSLQVEKEIAEIEQVDDENLTDIIDTNDYVFDKEIVKKAESSESFLSNYRRASQEDREPLGPLPYKIRFSADNMITSWVIDPLRGFGILLETEMNDMLQNHKFYGGIMTTTNLKSGDIFVEYQYLEQRIDYKIRFDRNVWYQDYDDGIVRQRYSKNKFEVGASLPLGPKMRVTFNPSYMFTRYQDLNWIKLLPNPEKVESNINSYLRISSEFVYDNTSVLGQNMIQGTRLKAQFSHNESVSDRSRSFSNFSLDLRHYQKLHRSLVFATRLFYGSFFGSYDHSYMLGGMDNWLFKNEPSSLSPWFPEASQENNNIYFMEYVTSLRGFDYNSLHGTNTLLLNFELRLPLVRYFYNGPVRSSFLGNLQFIGFYDIGSAWTGASPFSPENSISVITVGDDSFEAEIQTFKNPWLMSYGVGMRSVILGYFMKMDLAWPIEDNTVGSPKFYFTLGHDF
jgi:hypothetical protein